jgi:hypothetical protein
VHEKVEQFPIEDVLTDEVFLAYGVNEEPLPRKHEFPLRFVGEGYYGFNWVKYVYKMIVQKRCPCLIITCFRQAATGQHPEFPPPLVGKNMAPTPFPTLVVIVGQPVAATTS